MYDISTSTSVSADVRLIGVSPISINVQILITNIYFHLVAVCVWHLFGTVTVAAFP